MIPQRRSADDGLASLSAFSGRVFLTVAEVADVLWVSKMSVYRMIHSGELPAQRIGRLFRVRAKAVRELIEDSTVGSLCGPTQLGPPSGGTSANAMPGTSVSTHIQEARAMTITTESQSASLSRHFGARGGQLRISLTPRCQIGCSFCHNEGETPPRLTHEDPAVQPRPPALGAREILTTIEAMVAAGVRRVFITGGEPLVSALARPVLQGLPQTPQSYSTTLITNGLRLEKDLPWLAETRLDRIKVSLHYFSDETFAAIAGGRAGGVAKIKRAIEAAVEVYGPGRVDINTVLQTENEHEVRNIIAYALGLGVGMQFIELVGTEHNRELGVEHVPASSITGYLRQIAESEYLDSSGTGQNRRVFTIGGSTIDVIDASLGRYHVGQCSTCPVKNQCVEGFWALRLEAAGAIRPCLLREDLRLDVSALFDDPRALTAAITRHVDAFTGGAL